MGRVGRPVDPPGVVRQMVRRAFVLLLGTLALPVVLPMVLAACGGGYGGQYGSAPVALIPAPGPYQAAAPAPTAGTGRVAILLPMTGAHADLGQPMLQAAQLALD